MDLLNSVRKQRELFSQTLSMSEMPSTLNLDREVGGNNMTGIRRPALSPRNKKTGVSDARLLVSSLRSKREDLIKRYESTPTQDDIDQENNSTSNKKPVVDMSWLKEGRQTEEDRTGAYSGISRPAKVDYSKFEKRDEPTRPSGVFEGHPTSNISNNVKKAADSFSSTTLQSPTTKKKESVVFNKSKLERSSSLSSPKAKKLGLNPGADSWIKQDLKEDTDQEKNKVVDASWIKNDTCIGVDYDRKGAVSKAGQKPEIGNEGARKAPVPAWVKNVEDDQERVGSPIVKRKPSVTAVLSRDYRRKSVESASPWAKKEEDNEEELNPRAKLKPVKKISRNSDDRRKSAPASSWIKQGGTTPQDNAIDEKAKRPAVPPWMKNGKHARNTSGDKLFEQALDKGPNSEESTGFDQGLSSSLAPRSPVAKLGIKRFNADAKSPVSSPEWAKPKLVSPRAGSVNALSAMSSRATTSSSYVIQPQAEETTKVGIFKNKASLRLTKPVLSPSNNGIKAVRLKWEAAQRSPNTKESGSTKKFDFERTSNFSSLKKSMEKISLGIDAESLASQQECRNSDPCEELVETLSADQSSVLEYGDANFSFDHYNYGEDEEQEGDTKEEKSFDYEETSEGSTYKVDNYQKDFNAAIPIQSPWGAPPDAFDSIDSSEFADMKIISIAPSETEYESPVDVDQAGFITSISPTFQDYSQHRRTTVDRNLANGRIHHQVARNSLLFPPTQEGEEGKAYVMFAGEDGELDPIFQVDGEIENKLKSNKGMFKSLKKGLVGSTKKDAYGSFPEDTLEVSQDATDDHDTAISSITRSVISGTHGHGSLKSEGSGKPNMPLGVLNGFFKAARKLQQKSKRKYGRGRSMSNKPTIEQRRRGDMIVDFKPQAVMVPNSPSVTVSTTREAAPSAATATQQDVQLWPQMHSNAPVALPTALKQHSRAPSHTPIVPERSFGTYGGLAGSRSKAVDATIAAIPNLASW